VLHLLESIRGSCRIITCDQPIRNQASTIGSRVHLRAHCPRAGATVRLSGDKPFFPRSRVKRLSNRLHDCCSLIHFSAVTVGCSVGTLNELDSSPSADAHFKFPNLILDKVCALHFRHSTKFTLSAQASRIHGTETRDGKSLRVCGCGAAISR